MPANHIVYLELPASDVQVLKSFYGSLFGWTFQDWGADYAAVEGASLDGGINADPASRTKAPLPIIETSDIEGMQRKVQAAGATVTVPIFAYPGGRRFHFLDPAGNEMAVLQAS